MGKAALFILGAFVLSILSIGIFDQGGQYAVREQQSAYEYQVLARHAAHSGADRAESSVKRDLLTPEQTRTSVPAGDGTYDLDISRNLFTDATPLYGDLMVDVQGQFNGAEHDVEANLLYEAPLDAAVLIDVSENSALLQSLVLPTLTLTVIGGGLVPSISGIDTRVPWEVRADSLGRLPGVPAIRTTLASSEAYLDQEVQFGTLSVHALVGTDTVASGFDRTYYTQLFNAARADADVTYPGPATALIVPPPAGAWGTLADPKIVLINGALQLSGPALDDFSGAGILLIDGGVIGGILTISASNFRWDGLVMVRGPLLDVRLGVGTTIYGGLVIMDDAILCTPICIPTPVSPTIDLFTETRIQYSGEALAKIGERLSLVRDSTRVFVMEREETVPHD